MTASENGCTMWCSRVVRLVHKYWNNKRIYSIRGSARLYARVALDLDEHHEHHEQTKLFSYAIWNGWKYWHSKIKWLLALALQLCLQDKMPHLQHFCLQDTQSNREGDRSQRIYIYIYIYISDWFISVGTVPSLLLSVLIIFRLNNRTRGKMVPKHNQPKIKRI